MAEELSPEQRPLTRLRPWLDRFADLRIVVWGDLVADVFLYGSTNRVSREAPALVLCHESESLCPGAGGNAALNAAALGARVDFVGYLGTDESAHRLRELLDDRGIETARIVDRDDGSTPVKTRVMAGGHHTTRQQILRIDRDRPWRRDEDADAELTRRLRDALEDADAVLISDYGLGSVDPSIYAALREAAADALPITLDSRSSLLSFPEVTAATPNEGEVEAAVQMALDGDLDALEAAGRELLDRLESDALVITRGSAGMSVFEPGRSTVHLPIHGTDQVADVTGAGDTVIATLTLALAAGAEVVDAARLANVAAGLAVMKRGTATVPRSELARSLEEGP